MSSRLARLVLAPALAFAPATAAAHIGSVVARAELCAPPPLGRTDLPDGGVRFELPIVEADAFYRLAWSDGDNDPTGRFTFYYVDRQLPVAIDAPAAEMLGTIVRTRDGREARHVYVSCACGFEDAGRGCEDDLDAGLASCADGGARWCDDEIEWDTSAVPDGVYWIAAVNDDPPYHVYNTSSVPIRVVHGASAPPIVAVTRPDGLGPGADKSFRIEGLVVGARAPLTMDLAFGVNEINQAQNPLRPIAKDVPLVPDSDGRFSFDWDVSAIKAGVYFVNVTVTDADGLRTTTNSRYGVSIFHRPGLDGGSPPDASAPLDLTRADQGPTVPPVEGCDCALGSRRGSPPVATLSLALLVPLALARRRRAR